MDSSFQVIKVGIADMNVVEIPDSIRTTGLGSCVGLVLYDQCRKIAGMVHVMLPSSNLAKNGAMNRAKFADTAVPDLATLLVQKGARQSSLRAKLAGGAQMFQFSGGSDLMRIGPRNVEAVKDQLKQMKIPVIAEDVGGNNGRTIEFSTTSYMLQIKTVNSGVTLI
ncbi:chemotaxis protein CheD [Bacillus massilinigeriensis]|uniref:chemotaxis protein CheD n=1 Tax=Bacillus mediterraneensis TaxID=1805474 RepID=UPI0008F8DB0C|nr:chemotaxis protein CheD [Bacillus mediterraneensis]